MTKKKIVTITAILVVLLGGTACALYFNDQSSPKAEDQTNGIDYANPSDEQKKNGQDIKEENINEGDSKPGEPYNSESAPSQTEMQATDVGIEISRADVVNGKLQVGTIIQELSNSGSCTLTLEKEGQELVTETVGVQAISNYTTCRGFVIPTNDLAKGVWKLSIKYSRGSVTGTASREVAL